jgi:hypothetical protein
MQPRLHRLTACQRNSDRGDLLAAAGRQRDGTAMPAQVRSGGKGGKGMRPAGGGKGAGARPSVSLRVHLCLRIRTARVVCEPLAAVRKFADSLSEAAWMLLLVLVGMAEFVRMLRG